MYKILIENSMSIIYEDLGEENFKDNRIVGTLINEPGIKEFLELLPINEYILDTSGMVLGKKTYTTLSKKQAFFVYNEIFNQQEKEKKEAQKKIKSRI